MEKEPSRIVIDRRVRPHVGPRERRNEHVAVTYDRRRRSRDAEAFDELIRSLTEAGEFRRDGKRRRS